MRKYYEELMKKYTELNEKYDNEKNSVNKFVLSNEVKKYQEIIQNFKKIFFINFDNNKLVNNLTEKTQKIFLNSKQNSESRNDYLKKDYENRKKHTIEHYQKELKRILSFRSDVMTEHQDDKKFIEYNTIKRAREKILEAEEEIKNPKFDKAYPTDYMSDEEFSLFFDEVMTSFEKKKVTGKKKLEAVKKESEDYILAYGQHVNENFTIKGSLENLKDNKYLEGKALEIYENKYEKIKELTSTTSEDDAVEQYKTDVKPIESIIFKEEKKTLKSAVDDNLEGYYRIDDDTNKFEQLDTNKKYNKLMNSISTFKVDENTKNIQTILELMNQLGMVSEGVKSGESESKEYGFANFIKAKNEFIDCVNKPYIYSNETFINTFNKLEEEGNKLDTIFAKIEELLGDDYSTMPINVDSTTNTDVPQKYKKNLVIQAKFNSLYNTLAFIKEHNLSIEEFVKNPVLKVINTLNREYKEKRIDTRLKGKSKYDAILELSEVKETKQEINTYGLSRSLDIFVTSEKDEERKKEKALTTAAINLMGDGIQQAIEKQNNYFEGTNISQTIQNIFLEDEVLSYESVRILSNGAQENIRTGIKESEKPSVVDKVAREKNFEQKFEAALTMVRDFHNKTSHEDKNKIRTVSSLNMFESLQELTVKFMNTHDLDEKDKNGERLYSKAFVKRMKDFVSNPTRLREVDGLHLNIDADHQRIMSGLMKKGSGMMKKSYKNRVKMNNRAEKAYMKERKEIIKQRTSLEKQISKLEAKIDKYGLPDDKYERLREEKTRLEDRLHNYRSGDEYADQNRLNTLKSEYEGGFISKYYLMKRSEQIINRQDLSNIPAMFLHEESDYKSFNKYAKNVLKLNRNQMRDNNLMNEKKAEYQALIAESRAEKKSLFMNSILRGAGMSSEKKLSSDLVLSKIDQNKEKDSDNLAFDNYRINLDIKEVDEKAIDFTEYLEEELNKSKVSVI